MSKTFTLRLDNGRSSVNVSLVLPQQAVTIPQPVPVPNPVPVPRPVPPPPPPPPLPPPPPPVLRGSRTFSTSQSFSVPLGATSVTIAASGGGGGGGGYHKNCGSATKHPGGRGGNGYTNSTTVTIPSNTQFVANMTIGEGGSGGRGHPFTSEKGFDGGTTRVHVPGFNLVGSSSSLVALGGEGGNPGGALQETVNFSVSSRQLDGVGAITYPAWNATMNQYAVWSPDVRAASFDSSKMTYFPFTGTYTFFLQTDNSGAVYIDGSLIISASNNFASAPAQTTATITEGNHVIRVTGQNAGSWNSGNPAGVAALITGTGIVEQENGVGVAGQGGSGAAGGGGGLNKNSDPNGKSGQSGYVTISWSN